MKYDVFISCKSEDYHLAEKVYSFLTKNQVNTFLATEDLRRKAEYLNVIDDALESTTHFILFLSKPEYFNSNFVRHEWETYIAAHLNGRKKDGQAIVLLDNVSKDVLPSILLKFEFINFSEYEERILLYVDSPEARERRKTLLKKKVAEYNEKKSSQETLEDDIVDLHKKIDLQNKVCPVCENEIPIEEPYCEHCGWYFQTIFDTDDYEYSHLKKAQDIWNGLSSSYLLEKQKKEWSEERNSLKTEIKDLKQTINKIKINSDNTEITRLKIELENEKNKTKKLRKEYRILDKELLTWQMLEGKRKRESEIIKKEIIKNHGIIHVGNLKFRMINVAGGTIQTGEKKLTANDFMCGETLVTQYLWDSIMHDNQSYHKGYDLPVESLNIEEIYTFIEKLNQRTGLYFRLLTNVEWEYAAHGGKKSKGYKYSGSDDLDEVGWFADNSDNETHAVGRKMPNELGIFDMSGNVYEVCENIEGNDDNDSSYVLYGGTCCHLEQDCQISCTEVLTGKRIIKHLIGIRLAL